MLRRHAVSIPGIILFLSIILCGSGCRLSYLFHVAGGEIELLNGAMPIEEALESQPFTPDQRNRLLLVAKIKAFGEKELGLRKTSNYETVYPHRERNPIYMVAASEKDRFLLKTWWFPIVGDMPYLGFFDLNEARKEQADLILSNLDVFVGKAGAYSTLGWFQDPVTMNLLDGTTPQMVNTLLHEMTHVTLYVSGQGEFNEGLAVLVGRVGTFLFFEKTFGPAHPFTRSASDALADERLFSSFIRELMDALERVYGGEGGYEEKLVERKQVFWVYRKKFEALKGDFKTRQFAHFEKVPMNNAYLMTAALYHRNFLLFEAVLTEHNSSVKETIHFLEKFSHKKENLVEQLRKTVSVRRN